MDSKKPKYNSKLQMPRITNLPHRKAIQKSLTDGTVKTKMTMSKTHGIKILRKKILKEVRIQSKLCSARKRRNYKTS